MYSKSKSTEQAKRIQQARKLTRLRRATFAAKYGFNPSSLQAWEEGRYINGIKLETAQKLSTAFLEEKVLCDSNWLLNGSGEPARKLESLNFRKLQQENEHTKTILIETVEENFEIMEKNRLLTRAIEENNLIKTKRLINQGANAHLLRDKELYILTGDRQDTLLHLAAEHSGKEMIEYVVSLGIHPNIRNRHLDAPIHLSCLRDNYLAATTLVDLSADIEAASREGATPLLWCAYAGNIKCATLLINSYANINNTDFLGNTAAHWAAYNNQIPMLKLLHERGALLNVRNHKGITPIEWAVKNGHRNTVRALIDFCNIK